jgi:arylamine N-acetyltransferase
MPSAFLDEQIDAYLEHINIPSQFRRTSNPKANLDFLRALHTHQLCAIPFEDLSIHYSKGHDIILDPQFLFRKFVSSNGRGGYCMENGIFFNHILRALGFNAYLAGGRVRPRTDGVPGGEYMGWVHCINIVTFDDGSRYMTDVGYGGDGPIAPLPMIPDIVSPNIGTQELRLVHEAIPGQADASQKQWIYQFRNDPSKEFNACYSFLDQEFIHEDFEVMSFFTSKNPRSYMISTVVAVRFLHHDYQIYGKRMLVNDQVKENAGGKTQTLKELFTEQQRIQALKEDFGVTLTEEEQRAIYDTKLALA